MNDEANGLLTKIKIAFSTKRAGDLLDDQGDIHMLNTIYNQSWRMMTLLLMTASLLLATGCSRSEEEVAVTQPAPPEPETAQPAKIPWTTSSDAARSLYAEGQHLLDVGRGVQARRAAPRS